MLRPARTDASRNAGDDPVRVSTLLRLGMTRGPHEVFQMNKWVRSAPRALASLPAKVKQERVPTAEPAAHTVEGSGRRVTAR